MNNKTGTRAGVSIDGGGVALVGDGASVGAGDIDGEHEGTHVFVITTTMI